MFASNLPLKVASFILALVFSVSIVLFPISTILFTVICIVALSAAIVLAYLSDKITKL